MRTLEKYNHLREICRNTFVFINFFQKFDQLWEFFKNLIVFEKFSKIWYFIRIFQKFEFLFLEKYKIFFLMNYHKLSIYKKLIIYENLKKKLIVFENFSKNLIFYEIFTKICVLPKILKNL